MLAGAIVPPAAPAVASPEGTMVRAINKIRVGHGLSPLKRSPSLHHSSSRYARLLMVRDMFAHQARIAVASRFEWAGETSSSTGAGGRARATPSGSGWARPPTAP